MRPAYTSIRGQDPVWLLDLDLGGDVRRYATRAVVVSSDDGDLRYSAGLDERQVALGESLDKLGCKVDDPETDWAQYMARGGSVSNRVGTLRLWWPGLTFEQSIGVLTGRTTGVSYADPRYPERLAFTLDAAALDSPVLWPDPQATVDETTFLNVANTELFDAAIEGQRYPVVFGYPGSGDDDDGPFSVTVGLLVKYNALVGASNSRIMLSLGEIDAATVRVRNGDTKNPTTDYDKLSVCTVATDTDLLGRTYSYAWFPTPATDAGAYPVPGDTHFVGYRNGAGYGGGILNRERTGPLRGLGEVIRYCLETSGVQVDTGRLESERDLLDAFKIDAQVAGGDIGAVNLAEWVNDELTRLFPIRRVRSTEGLFYRYWNWTARVADAVARLDADRGDVTRASAIRTTEGVANVFTLEYKTRAPGGGGLAGARRTLAPSYQNVYRPGLGQDIRVLGSSVCQRSYQRYGRYIEAEPVTTGLIWSDSTASAILEHWAARDALPLETVSYEGQHLEHLEIGDVVAITDTSASLTDRVGLVDEVVVGGRTTTLRLTLLAPEDVLTS